MRKIDHLLTLVRQRTKNPDYSSTSGIANEMFLEFYNQAQDRLQAVIANVYSNEFITDTEIAVTGADEDYSISDRVLANSKIVNVEFSPTGLATDYYLLERGNIRDRKTIEGSPSYYIFRDGEILLNYIPSSTQGKIRATYYRELDDLDIERGTVSGTPSGTTVATSNMDITSSPVNATNVIYICITDKFGNVMLRNGIVASWSSPNFTLAANVSTYLVGSYSLANLANGSITFGKYTTTFSKLSDTCERYLQTYVQKRILTLDESNTSLEEDLELKAMEEEISATYTDETRDVELIPILDDEIVW